MVALGCFVFLNFEKKYEIFQKKVKFVSAQLPGPRDYPYLIFR